LKRLGLQEVITQVLPMSLILPAIGQGALGLQTRRDNEARSVIASLDDAATHQAVTAERTLLATLRGGCLAPVGAWGRIEADGQLHLTAAVLSRNGRQRVAASAAGDPLASEAVGRQVAEDLLAQGAAELIATARDR
jgi:hydroxymethylbilane synthase